MARIAEVVRAAHVGGLVVEVRHRCPGTLAGARAQKDVPAAA
jgi:hypothetical protein